MLDEVQRELTRTVDRLTSMPLNRLPAHAARSHACCEFILAQTRAIDPEQPSDPRLPLLEPSGLGWQLAVIGGDFLDAARASRTPVDSECQRVRDALVELRRELS